jgi:hypothetical protein
LPLAAGAKIRDLAMVGRIEHDDAGRVIGVHYHRNGERSAGNGGGRRGDDDEEWVRKPIFIFSGFECIAPDPPGSHRAG